MKYISRSQGCFVPFLSTLSIAASAYLSQPPFPIHDTRLRNRKRFSKGFPTSCKLKNHRFLADLVSSQSGIPRSSWQSLSRFLNKTASCCGPRRRVLGRKKVPFTSYNTSPVPRAFQSDLWVRVEYFSRQLRQLSRRDLLIPPNVVRSRSTSSFSAEGS